MKNRNIILLFVFFLFVCHLHGQTYISGNVSGTWTKENSPYIATGDVIVDDGQQLRIEAGVEVLFNGNYELLVKGQLEAFGSETDKIIFSKNTGYDFWAGIRFQKSDGLSTLEYCKIEYGKADGSHGDGSFGEWDGGGIFIYPPTSTWQDGKWVNVSESKILLKNCCIANNTAKEDGGGVYGSPVLIESCEFKNNKSNHYGGGLFGSPAKILSSVFDGNFAKYDGGAIYTYRSAFITKSIFKNNSTDYYGGAVYLNGSYPEYQQVIYDSRFIDNISKNGGGALYSKGVAILCRNLFKTNKTKGKNGAVIFFEGWKGLLSNCVIDQREVQNYYNKSSVYFRYSSNFSCKILNSILSNTSFGCNEYFEVADVLDVEFSNIEGGWQGESNIDADPLFVDAGNGNYQLQASSPCIDAGNPSGFYSDDDGSRNDMGIYGGSGLAVMPDEIDFGPLGLGQSKQDFFTLYNFRENDFIVQASEPNDGSNFSVQSQFPLTIPPMNNDTIYVEFAPQNSGDIQSKLTVTSPDFRGTQTAELGLKGLGGVFIGEVSGTWTRQNSPYYIGGTITIPVDETLIIEPGVEVLIDTELATKAKIIVEGSLQAIGTETDSILFAPKPGQETKGVWEGIHFEPPYPQTMSQTEKRDSLRNLTQDFEEEINKHKSILKTKSKMTSVSGSELSLKYCRISHARTGVLVESDNAAIENCRIASNLEIGVKWEGIDRSASGKLLNCVITDNDSRGIYCYAECFDDYAHASPEIRNNTITRNGTGIFLYADGGRPSSWTWPGGTWDECHVAPEISGNIISHNVGWAIECLAEGATATGTFSTHKSAAYTKPLIKNNIIYDNQSGIKTESNLYGDYVLSFSDIRIDRNTFYDNPGVQLQASDSTSKVAAVNSIFRNYASQLLRAESDAKITVNYCDLETVADGTGNISADPLFVDAASRDFSLTWLSPCIDAGEISSDNDPDGTRADMGALHYHQSLSAFSLVSPPNDTVIASRTPVLRWEASTTSGNEPVNYELHLSTKSNFNDSLTTVVTGLENNYYSPPDSLNDSQEYFWKVRAKNPWNLEKWCLKTWHFTVNTDTLPPVFADSLPVLQFNEDENLELPRDFWHDYVEDAHCPDSTLDFEIQPGSHLKVLGDSVAFSITAKSDWFGIDSLKITVTDKSNLSATAHIKVVVQPVNDPPVISGLPDSIFFRTDSDYSLNVAEHVSDIDTPDSLLNYIFQCENDSIICLPDAIKKGVVTLSAIRGFAGKSVLNIAVCDASDTTHAEISVRVDYPTGMNIFSNTIPTSFQLYQNFPNPFNPRTIIPFSLPEDSDIKITVYNINGEIVDELFNGKKQQGNHIVIWDANNYSSGTYFIRLETPELNQTRKCLLMK